MAICPFLCSLTINSGNGNPATIFNLQAKSFDICVVLYMIIIQYKSALPRDNKRKLSIEARTYFRRSSLLYASYYPTIKRNLWSVSPESGGTVIRYHLISSLIFCSYTHAWVVFPAALLSFLFKNDIESCLTATSCCIAGCIVWLARSDAAQRSERNTRLPVFWG